uniref:Uncharacterized protein n=1 Tax=Ditylenchus dipsaci TaxID=166011 RepID=A0A915E3X1_9BILA
MFGSLPFLHLGSAVDIQHIYLLDKKNLLTPEIAFVSLTLFNQLRTPMSTNFLVAEELNNYVENAPLIRIATCL